MPSRRCGGPGQGGASHRARRSRRRLDCDEVTAALTRFADACIAAAVDWLLREAERAGRLATWTLKSPDAAAAM
jgi:glutamine synthetase adenylyltransferase